MLEISSPDKPVSPDQPIKLFFAILPDAAGASQAHEVAGRLRGSLGMSGRPLAVDRLHVTLFSVGGFVGSVPRELMQMALAAGDAICLPPVEVSLDRAVSFARSTGKRPYVLLGGDGVASIMPLYRALGGAMLKAGLHVGMGPFNPHMTLLYDASHQMEQSIHPISWVAREFVLIESWVGLTRHILRGRWKLA